MKKSWRLFRDIFDIPKDQNLRMCHYTRGHYVYFTCDKSPLAIQVGDYVHFGTFRKIKKGVKRMWAFWSPYVLYDTSYDNFPSIPRYPKNTYRRMLWNRNDLNKKHGAYKIFLNKKQVYSYMLEIWEKIAIPHCSLTYFDTIARGNTVQFGGFAAFRIIQKIHMPKIIISGFLTKPTRHFRSWIEANYPEILSYDYPQIYTMFDRYRQPNIKEKYDYYHLCAILFQRGMCLNNIAFSDELDDHTEGVKISPIIEITCNLKPRKFWETQYKSYKTFLFGCFDKNSIVYNLFIELVDIHIKPFIFPKKVIKKMNEQNI